MTKINWGIIGCGDVTEVKSGPAFNKVPDSGLLAVMRRDAKKAEDYAKRHGVPRWYTDASMLINDPDINAVYIATPPSSHEEYCLAAARAGKHVYVEKPMTLNAASAGRMAEAAASHSIKLVVAHYRRAQPFYVKLKELIEQGHIGTPRTARLDLYRKALTPEELAIPKTAWRVNGNIAGGGLFHDLAPHQLDILYHLFGTPSAISGMAYNQAGLYATDDVVAASIRFGNGLLFQGTWCFTLGEDQEKDNCSITGDRGWLQFSFFDNKPLIINSGTFSREMLFDPLPHVQQPMIARVVDFFLDRGPNPCTAEEGIVVMDMLDRIVR